MSAERKTTRERREARAARREEWAEKRAARGEATAERTSAERSMIPFGQPILVGHHSAGRHMRAMDRMARADQRVFEDFEMAKRHESKAANIRHQLDTSIFSDDVDAVERLAEKLAGLEARRDAMKAANAEYRKAHKAELKALTPFGRDQVLPHPKWEVSNLGGNISRTRKRLAELQAKAATR